jgi:hypothetical protein
MPITAICVAPPIALRSSTQDLNPTKGLVDAFLHPDRHDLRGKLHFVAEAIGIIGGARGKA